VARYLSQLDTSDRQEPSEALATRTAHLKEKLAKLASELQRLKAIEQEMLASPDQISLTDPDARSMATSGRGSGVVGYNVQVAVDKGRDPSSQGWGTFLRNHAPHIAAMDLFVVPTVGFNLLYVLVIVRLARKAADDR
jgi:hypothetical protein